MKKSLLLLVLFFILSQMAFASEIDPDLKTRFNTIFDRVSSVFNERHFNLPDGLEILEGDCFRGIKARQGALEIRVDTWSTDEGLLDRYKFAKKTGRDIVAAVNGTFHSKRRVLGQVISDEVLPSNVQQMPGGLSRCFLAAFRGDQNRQFWYIGETSIKGSPLLSYSFAETAWLNTPDRIHGRIEQLLGGGGWLVKNFEDIHTEAFNKQRFRFKLEDEKNRKTILAQDTSRSLYFIVFDTGLDLAKIVQILLTDEFFATVKDAFFIDGGLSSAIVIEGKYFVAPLYLIDSARYTSIQILLAPAAW